MIVALALMVLATTACDGCCQMYRNGEPRCNDEEFMCESFVVGGTWYPDAECDYDTGLCKEDDEICEPTTMPVPEQEVPAE